MGGYEQSIIDFPEESGEEKLEVEEINNTKYNSSEVKEGDEKMKPKLVPDNDVDLVRRMVSIVESKQRGRDIYYIQEKAKDLFPPDTKNIFEKLKYRANKYLDGYHRGGWKTKKYTGLKEGWKLPPEPEKEPTWDSYSGHIMRAIEAKEN